jgi:hypothetical protein
MGRPSTTRAAAIRARLPQEATEIVAPIYEEISDQTGLAMTLAEVKNIKKDEGEGPASRGGQEPSGRSMANHRGSDKQMFGSE